VPAFGTQAAFPNRLSGVAKLQHNCEFCGANALSPQRQLFLPLAHATLGFGEANIWFDFAYPIHGFFCCIGGAL
jgi:hypothetical protein